MINTDPSGTMVCDGEGYCGGKSYQQYIAKKMDLQSGSGGSKSGSGDQQTEIQSACDQHVKYCILKNGGIIDNSHLATGNAKELKKQLLLAQKGNGKGLVTLEENRVIITYSLEGVNQLNDDELVQYAESIWQDFQSKIETAQLFPSPATTSSYNYLDLPSTQVGFVMVMKNKSYEEVIENDLGGGFMSVPKKSQFEDALKGAEELFTTPKNYGFKLMVPKERVEKSINYRGYSIKTEQYIYNSIDSGIDITSNKHSEKGANWEMTSYEDSNDPLKTIKDLIPKK